MKKILILYPHFPPSNLAGVHRPRLFAQHLPSFGWEPTILTVHEKFYEEAPDWNLVKLLPPDLRIEKVKAFPITKPRLVGDIGLRAFFQLYKKAKHLIKNEGYDFLYIPIPSFYIALLGRMLHRSTGIKYGIDYIDPWVHRFPGSDKVFSRHWWSSRLAQWLEPIAVKNASLITGVAEGYYRPVLERNPMLAQRVVHGAMPYGGEARDHDMLKQLEIYDYLFQNEPGKIQLVYAGAMLPKAYAPLEAVFQVIANHKALFALVEFIFIGTGKTPDDPHGYNIRPLAEKYGLWNSYVKEYPKRIPYLDVLRHLQEADGVFILGSTEPHYTPSKSYQAVLSDKPILALLHEESTAVAVLKNFRAARLLSFNSENFTETILKQLPGILHTYLLEIFKYKPEDFNREIFKAYSAEKITGDLAKLLDEVMLNK